MVDLLDLTHPSFKGTEVEEEGGLLGGGVTVFILAFAGGMINSRVDDALCVRSVTRHARGGSAAGNSFPSTCRARVLYSYPAERVLLFIKLTYSVTVSISRDGFSRS